jgi:ABC-type Fe3+ transport system permease subunit
MQPLKFNVFRFACGLFYGAVSIIIFYFCIILSVVRQIGWDRMDWVDVAQDRDQWRALENTVMNLINSVALVRKRTIPTKGPPLIGEVNANFCG